MAQNQSFFHLRGWEQLFMDVSSCTGPIMNEELQAVMLGGELKLWGGGSSLAPVPMQYRWIVPLLWHLVCEEYKHSASVQSLLITPETG